MRSTQRGPSSSMNSVRNAIVTTPAMNVATLRVTSIAALAPPASDVAGAAVAVDGLLDAVDDVVVALEEAERPAPGGQLAGRSPARAWMRSPTCCASVGMISAPMPPMNASTMTKTVAAADPRRRKPWRWSKSTAGFSASASRTDTKIHTSTRSDISTTFTSATTPSSTRATIRTVRGRTVTTCSERISVAVVRRTSA